MVSLWRGQVKRNILVILAILVFPSALAAQLTIDGLIVDRPNRYDGYPTHFFKDGVHHLFFCGHSFVTNHDAIYHVTNSIGLYSLSTWSAPVEVINHFQVPWANQHVCDPTIVYGPVTYNSTSYNFMLHFTANDLGQGDNAIGVAFSNDGFTWLVHPTAVMNPDGGFDGSYGAGAGSGAWGESPGIMVHLFRDSTTSFGDWRIRYKESTDGVNFTPAISIDTQMAQASNLGFGSSPAVAFYPLTQDWRSAIHNVSGSDPGKPVRLLRAASPNDLFGAWSTTTFLDGLQAGEEIVLLPALSRTETSALYVDQFGWSFLFYTAGKIPSNPPGVNSWYVGQSRYRVFRTPSTHFADSFTSLGPLRAPGAGLNTRQTEIGSRKWIAQAGTTFDNGAITTAGGTVGRIPFSIVDAPNDAVLTVEAKVDPAGSSWVGIGFFDSAAGGFFLNGAGEVWMHLTSTGDVRVNANDLAIQLANVPAASFTAGFNLLRLSYNTTTHLVNAWVNDEQVVLNANLSTLGFTPNFQYAGFQFLGATSGQTRLDEFAVNGPFGLISEDNFEMADLSGWDVAVP